MWRNGLQAINQLPTYLQASSLLLVQRCRAQAGSGPARIAARTSWLRSEMRDRPLWSAVRRSSPAVAHVYAEDHEPRKSHSTTPLSASDAADDAPSGWRAEHRRRQRHSC